MAAADDKENNSSQCNASDSIVGDHDHCNKENKERGDPRLMILKIENNFFKSYAGLQVLGPFHKSFTSIVGPNGSGKSNVIDAMLFVFGYRSRRIRSKKLSLLIHNSSKYPNVDSCSVAVHFQMIYDLPGDDYEVVPESQFVVSRTARKDGSSDYYIDGKRSSFKDVGALLRKSGIDLDHNRFLILQGEVEQISMMKPMAENEHDEGMLEYLEDIIGSSRFKEPLEQLNKEVEQLNELRGEKLNRVKSVEKEKDELEGPKNESMEYLKMENEIAKKRNVLYQKYIHECCQNEAKAKEKRDGIQKQLDEIQNQLKEIGESKKEKGKKQKKVLKLFERLSKEAEEKKKAFAEFEKVDLKLREDLKHRRENGKKLEKNLQKEKEKLMELKKVPEKSQKELEKFENAKTELEKQKREEEEKLSEIMEGLKTETMGLQAEKEAKEQTLLERQKVVNEAKSKLEIASSELELYLSQHKTLQGNLETVMGNIKMAEEKLAWEQSAVEDLKKEVPTLKNDLQVKKTSLGKLSKEEEQFSFRVKGSRTKAEEAKSAFQSSKSRSNVLSALLNEKKAGRLKGIYGRLGDLGSIDDKYDVAISTACGPLDFVVVDTIDTAQKCVEFLKRNNIGSTTFIALDKVEVWRKRAGSKMTTPENVPRLFDLLEVKDDKIITAFYFALKDTLVASNLEQASRIAYGKDKRYRVVTEKGELIEQSGTMSGGGTKVARGRMGCAYMDDIKPEDIEALEKALENDLQKLQTLREEKSKLEEDIAKIEKEINDKEHNLEKGAMEIGSLVEQKKEQEARVPDLQRQIKEATPDPVQSAKLQKAVNSYEKEYKKSSTAAADIEKDVQKLHQQIMDIGGSKLKGQQIKLDSVTKLIDEVTSNITKANVAIKSSSRNIKKSEEKVNSIEKEQKENTDSLKQLEEDFAKLDEQATQVLEDHQAAQEKMAEIEDEVKRVQAICSEEDGKETELKSNEVDVKHDFEKYVNVVKENQQKIKHWQKELSRLSLHDVGDSSTEEGTTEETSLKELSLEELENLDKEVVMYNITVAEERMAQMRPNMAAIEEYRQKETAYLAKVSELDKVTEERDSKRKDHDTMRKQRLDEFMTGFGIITNKLKEMYQMITLGGDAELELVDSLDPFSEGIVFSVRPPKKSWKNIAKLSGGEKTLSSLALVFALHHYKPTPLYVMDEIDAALDFKNVSIVGNYIKERTKDAQFIIISLRNNMFELADRLVGIYKTSDCTKSVAINPKAIGVS